jgi:hypothetical protein
MKSIKHLAVLLTGIFMLAACQKEYSLETGSLGGMAVGTLRDSLADCKPITIRGLYFADSTVTDSNYVVVQVNITTPGSYVISTDRQNGLSFRDSGYFSSAGIINVKLKATGRPLLPVTSDFTVTFDTSFCLFSIAVLPKTGGGGGPQAAYTLAGTATNCSGAVVQGTYTTSTALGAGNRVNLQVNVTTPGTYSLATTTTNGITFSGSGSFTTTGIQTVTLQGSGRPTTAGATQVPVATGGTSCQFTVNVTGGTNSNINLADSAWQFTQGTKTYHGTLDSVVFSNVNGIDVLQFYGLTFATGDSLFVLGIGMTSSNIQPGTYNTSTFAVFEFSDVNNKKIYQANPTTITPPVNLSIVLAYDTATKIASGTFTGTALNAANASVPVTNGKFRARLP